MKPELDDEGYVPLQHDDVHFMTFFLVAGLVCVGVAIWLA